MSKVLWLGLLSRVDLSTCARQLVGRYKNLKAAFCNLPSPKEFGDVSTKVRCGDLVLGSYQCSGLRGVSVLLISDPLASRAEQGCRWCVLLKLRVAPVWCCPIWCQVMIDRNGMLKVTHVIRMQQQGHGQAQGMALDWAGGGAYTQVRANPISCYLTWC